MPDEAPYLGITMKGFKVTREGIDDAADFRNKAKPLELFLMLLKAGEHGMQFVDAHSEIYREPRTDNALHQLKSSANEVIAPINLEITAERSMWRIEPLNLEETN